MIQTFAHFCRNFRLGVNCFVNQVIAISNVRQHMLPYVHTAQKQTIVTWMRIEKVENRTADDSMMERIMWRAKRLLAGSPSMNVVSTSIQMFTIDAYSHVDAFDSKNSRRQLVPTRIRNWATVLRYCPSSMSLRQPSCSRQSFSIDTSLASAHCCSSSFAFDHKQQTAFLDVLLLLRCVRVWYRLSTLQNNYSNRSTERLMCVYSAQWNGIVSNVSQWTDRSDDIT